MRKTGPNGYHFIYRNQAVKPALIGMTGAWTPIVRRLKLMEAHRDVVLSKNHSSST